MQSQQTEHSSLKDQQTLKSWNIKRKPSKQKKRSIGSGAAHPPPYSAITAGHSLVNHATSITASSSVMRPAHVDAQPPSSLHATPSHWQSPANSPALTKSSSISGKQRPARSGLKAVTSFFRGESRDALQPCKWCAAVKEELLQVCLC